VAAIAVQAFALAEDLGPSPTLSLTCSRTGVTVPQVANPIRMPATPPTYRLAPPPHRSPHSPGFRA
jgi:hypothetical protein